MKKLLISTSVATALALGGCGGGETIGDLEENTPTQSAFSRILFDPGAGNLNIPNDLLMLPGDDGFFDYTLNIPVADPTNFGDPTNALNVLDGWSTNQPFVIDVVTPPGVSLDASTLSAGISLYEATLGLNQADPVCAAIPVPSAGCKVGAKLTYGVDYVLSLLDSNTVTFVPLKPLKPSQGYMLVMDNNLKDSTGRSVRGSSTWELVKQDPAVAPLGSQAQLDLQNLVNSYIVSLAQVGVTRDEVTYAAAFTTQSTLDTQATIKQLMVSEFAQRAALGDPTAGQALPAIVATDVAAAPNAMEALNLVSDTTLAGAVQLGISGLSDAQTAFIPAIEAADFSALQTCSGLIGTVTGQMATTFGPLNDFAVGVANGILPQVGAFCAAKRAEASITLPYYLATPRADNPLAPVNEFMNAACDSGIILAAAPAEALAAATPGPNHALCSAVGLADLGLDTARNLTKFSPVPQPKGRENGNETIDVQITVPDPVVAGALGYSIAEPDAGWPVAILFHGITSQKEDMLAITGALSLAGVATVAIDQPLHGSRGFDLNGDGVDDLNATTVSATHYMNLSSLPTARDNSRQAISDLLGLRLGLNAVVDTTVTNMVNLDASNVSIMGVSLGAINGGNFAAIANQSMGGDLAALDGMFEIKAASLESPGTGIASFLLESVAFSPLIKALLLNESSADFQNFLAATYGDAPYAEAQLVAGVTTFLSALSDQQLAGVNAVFSQFIFAAQTVLDATDPINYVELLASNTPSHVMTVVGDGGDNLPDQVIPVSTAVPLAGQTAYVNMMGIDQVSASVQSADPISGYVLFNEGAHGSSLNPGPSGATTLEMQSQVATFIASGGRVLPIGNTTIVVD